MWLSVSCNVFERPIKESAQRYRAFARSLKSGSGGVNAFAQLTCRDDVNNPMEIENVRVWMKSKRLKILGRELLLT